MKIETEFPFDNENGYVVKNRDNRKMVCLVNKHTKRRTTISLARYLMSVKEKRILDSKEHVDHINGNKEDDRIENLQILSQLENSRKSFLERKLTLKMVTLKCPECGKIMEKPLRNTHLQKKGHYSSCSRECSYSILRRGLSITELKQLGKDQVIKYYRK